MDKNQTTPNHIKGPDAVKTTRRLEIRSGVRAGAFSLGLTNN